MSSARSILKAQAAGVVALSGDGEVLGFLFARRDESPDWDAAVVADADAWGLVPEAGSGTLAALYAAGFAPESEGVAEHRVYCPARQEMLQAWFHLGFGMEQAYAAARLEDVETSCTDVAGLEIRRARAGDERTLVGLSPLIATMQAGAPVWAGAPARYLAALREGFARLPSDPDGTVLLAFRGGRAVGYQAWFPMEEHAVDGVTEGAVELPAAATVPEERGSGVGRALTARGVSEALDSGYTVCFTDWRTANPLASAFWQDRGFRPFLYRLVRRFAAPIAST